MVCLILRNIQYVYTVQFNLLALSRDKIKFRSNLSKLGGTKGKKPIYCYKILRILKK